MTVFPLFLLLDNATPSVAITAVNFVKGWKQKAQGGGSGDIYSPTAESDRFNAAE